MKNKLIAILMTVAMTAAMLMGCGSGDGQQASTGDSGQDTPGTEQGTDQDAPEEGGDAESEDSSASAEGKFRIGVIQLMEHPALDASYEGFVEGLKEAGYVDGENITIDYQNAQGEQANCQTIAEKFVNDDVDLVLAIATPAAQAMVSKTTEIPILVTAVTDPASSGLVESNEVPGGNVSGTSDLTPVKEQIDLLHQILPEAKNVGILYCSSEDNSEFQADMAIEALQALGMSGEKYTISTLDEVQAVVDSMKGKVDAIYSPTDNMIANGMPTVSMIANEAGIPTIVGESGMVENGGLATYGLSYFNLGKLTAEQAVSILKGEADTATMPIGYLEAEDCEFDFSQETADALGITIDPTQFQ